MSKESRLWTVKGGKEMREKYVEKRKKNNLKLKGEGKKAESIQQYQSKSLMKSINEDD